MTMSGVFSRKNYVVCALALAMLPPAAWAYVDGEIIPEEGTKVYNVTLDNSSITDNTAGGEVTSQFQVDGSYTGRTFCTSTWLNAPVSFQGTAALPSLGDGYMTLNEYMDVKVEIFIVNNGFLTVPFGPVSNNNKTNTCTKAQSDLGNGVVLYNLFDSGGQGKVTFRLKKPIINGISLVGTEVAKIFGRLGEPNAGTMSTTPLASVVIESAIVTVPDKCVINDGQPITVDFGQVGNTAASLNGENYTQNVPIKVQCKGGSFDTGNVAIKVGIQASQSSFNSNYLGTTGSVDRSNLGIWIKDKSGNTIVPNTFYEIPGYDNNQGVWDLVAAPIAGAATVPEGDFESSATVIALFQ